MDAHAGPFAEFPRVPGIRPDEDRLRIDNAKGHTGIQRQGQRFPGRDQQFGFFAGHAVAAGRIAVGKLQGFRRHRAHDARTLGRTGRFQHRTMSPILTAACCEPMR